MTRAEALKLYWSFLSSKRLKWGEPEPEVTPSDLEELSKWASVDHGDGFVTDLFSTDAAIIAKEVVRVLSVPET